MVRAWLSCGARRLSVRRQVEPVLRERRGEEFRVIAGSRSNVEHGHRWREPQKCERLDRPTVPVAICGAGRAVRSVHGGGDRGTAGGDGSIRRWCLIRYARAMLLGAATTEEHRGYENERYRASHATILAGRLPFGNSFDSYSSRACLALYKERRL